ncbi:MAG: hypothetical protein RL598_1175, partial [Verrucomicrobiota bacterium]
MKLFIRLVVLALCAGSAWLPAEDLRHGQPKQAQRPTALYVPDLNSLVPPAASELRELVERFKIDRESLLRVYSVPNSTLQLRRLREFYQSWQEQLDAMSYDALGTEGRIDWQLMRLQLRYELGLIARTEKRHAEMASFMGFADDIAALQETRREFEPVAAASAAATLEKIRQAIEDAQRKLAGEVSPPNKILAYRVASRLGDLSKTLKDWYEFYDGYDPQFSWWNREPYKKTAAALDDYAKFLREKIV